LASGRLSSVLALEVALAWWAAADRKGPAGADPANEHREPTVGRCPYRKSNPSVLMVQPTKDRPHFDAPSALNDPSNRRILA
jgi:hypothetical protein